MSRPVKFNGKVYRPTKFGEGMQPGTVEWEINCRRDLAAERAWKERQPPREPEIRLEDYGVAHPLTSPLRRFFDWIGRHLRRAND